MVESRLAALAPRVAQMEANLAKATEGAADLSAREGALNELDRIRDQADAAYQRVGAFETFPGPRLILFDPKIHFLFASFMGLGASIKIRIYIWPKIFPPIAGGPVECQLRAVVARPGHRGCPGAAADQFRRIDEQRNGHGQGPDPTGQS